MDMPPMPQDNSMMGGGMPPMENDPLMATDPNGDQMPPMGDGQNQPMDGGNMGDSNQDFGNQFDNHFDAGVEADENEDPENYIKQLTGKLAQKLRSFNKDNGNDESLNKYAAKMVIKAAAENMSPEAKSELKQAVNTSSEGEDEEDMDNSGSDMPMDDAGMSQDQNMESDNMQQPMNENFKVLTKRELREAFNSLNGSDNTFEKKDKTIKKNNNTLKKEKKNTNPFSGPNIRK